MIVGVTCNSETEARLRALDPDVEPDRQLNFQVFEVTVDDQVRYCCVSGGTIRDDDGRPTGEPRLTLVGRAALEALLNLPFVNGKALGFCELRQGRTPLQEKIVERFRMSADTQDLLCFIGDLAGELDGQILLSFNFSGIVNVEDCVGIPAPGEASKQRAGGRP